MRRKLLAALWTFLALAFTLVEPALAGNGGIAPPDPVSPSAEWIRDVYWLVLGITGALLLLVETALILFIVRYRGRGRAREAEGPQVIGHHRLELVWTAIPVLIVAAIVAFTLYKLPGINDAPDARASGDVLRIKVEGRQFYWRYVYPNGRVAVNLLQVPVNRPVELALTAPVHDVNHAWWVPRLAGKKDAIPGETNYLWFQAEEAGLYRGQCAEFCGDQHALMVAQVRAVAAEEYETWLNAPPAGLGEQTWQGACAPCHGMQGEGLIGPKLAGTGLDAPQVEQIVRQGRGAMPAVGKGWDETQMRALLAYVRTEIAQERGGAGGG